MTNTLRESLKEFASGDLTPLDTEQVHAALTRLFPTSEVQPDWQKIAAAVALSKRLCVISGGPGTGKTTTVLNLLTLLCELSESPLRIGLAAPTGKAAARMQDSIRGGLETLDCAQVIKQQLAVNAATLHRLLGFRPNSVNFRHDSENPLALDVLVVDESSMIDTAMMSKLLDTLPGQTRLILLGDKDQLPAVDPGSPFAELCGNTLGENPEAFSTDFAATLSALTGQELEVNASGSDTTLSDCLVLLKHSYRFGSDSGIGQLAQAVNADDYGRTMQLLEDTNFSDIQWQEYSPAQYRRYNSVEADPLVARIKAGFSGYMKALNEEQPDPEAIFDQFSRFCVLTATHGGYSGREESNRLAASALDFNEESRWYHGRPVMVVKNDYQTGLFNGDVGICLKLDGDLRVYFPDQEGFKSYTPSRVSAHETAFAITVYKSQGSEFQHVLMLLPDGQTRVVSRALIYTGITQAKDSLELWGSAETFLA